MTGVPAAARLAADATLRSQIGAHLAKYPVRLTAFEIARALRHGDPAAGRKKVFTTLEVMEAAGEARRVTEPREPGASRPAIRWETARPAGGDR